MINFKINIKQLSVFFMIVFCFFILPSFVSAASLYWVGADGANVNVASNWCTTVPTACAAANGCAGGGGNGTVPGTSDVATFKSTCTNGATINSTWSVSGFLMDTNYTGTITQSADLTTSGNYSQTNGVFTGGANNITVGGDFILSGGTFTAPNASGSFTVAGSFTKSNSPTFNANSGTVTFGGTLAADTSINASGVTFNIVVINRTNYKVTGPTLTIVSGTTIPLGNSPTVTLNNTYGGIGTYNLTNNGTITVGTGTWTANVSILTNNSIINANSASAWAMNGSFTNSGTVNITGVSLFNFSPYNGGIGSFTNSSGATFNSAPTPTFNVAGSFIVSNTSAVFPANASLNLNGGYAGDTSIDANGYAFVVPVTINRTMYKSSGRTLTIVSGTTIPLGNSPTVTLNNTYGGVGIYDLNNSGTITVGTGTWTVNVGGTFINNGTITANSASAWAMNGSFTNSGTMNITGVSSFNFNISSGATGSFTNSSGATFNSGVTPSFNVAGSFTVSSSSTVFPAVLSGITFNGTSGTQTLNAPNITSFGSLTKNYASTLALSQSITTTGVTFSSGIIGNPASSYTIFDSGNFSESSSGAFGGTNLTMELNGTSNQSVSKSGGTFSSLLRINRTGETAGTSANLTTTFATSGSSATTTVFAGTFNLNNQSFTSGGIFTIQNGGVLELFGSETPTAPVLNTGSTVTYNGSGSYPGLILGNSYSNLTFNGSGIWTLNAAIAVNKNFTIAQGTVDASTAGCAGASCAITVTGNWSNAGTFNAHTGTVTLNDGAGLGQKIFGSTTFYNLTKDISLTTADTLMFQNGKTQTIAASGTLTLKGSSTNLLTLRSCGSDGTQTDGTAWNLSVNPSATASVSYVNVKDSDAHTGQAISPTSSTTYSSDINWGAAPTVSSTTTNTAGTIVSITFSKAMNNPSAYYSEFSVNNGSSNAVTAAALHSGDSTTIDLTVTTPILNGQTVTASYSGSDITSTDTGVLASFSNHSVTNNGPTTISVTAILGVTQPIANATPVTTITAGTGYTGTVLWDHGNPSTFSPSTIYTATITINPTTGYTLQGVTENQFTIANATSATNSANSGVITAAFPITASSSKTITSFTFSTSTNTTINGTAIAVSVPYGTDITALVATFATTGSSVAIGLNPQVSGTTSNNFTSSQTYTVTAADGSTQNYSVTVVAALNSFNSITSFSFAGLSPAVNASINGNNITANVPYGTATTNLVATFATTGSSVTVGSNLQTSGSSANDFSNSFLTPVVYTVTAANNSTQSYSVTVTPLPSTTASAEGTYTFGTWSKSNVTASLSCADAGSGCLGISYCTDTSNLCTPAVSGTAYGTYSSPIPISTEGTSYIRYFSTDKNGNSETVQSQIINIDTKAPTTSNDFTSDKAWISVDPIITLVANDGNPSVSSGIAWTKYCEDTGSTDTPCDPSGGTDYKNTPVLIAPTSTSSTIYFRYASADNAGNIGQTITLTVMIDTTLQQTQVVVNSVDVSSSPKVSANITITNEGNFDYEYTYDWCIVSDASGVCDHSNESSKKIFAKQTINIPSLPLITESTPGTYYFKVIVYYNGITSYYDGWSSPASLSFTINNAMSVITPPASSGGEGYAYPNVNIPQGGFTISINSGAAATNNSIVTLTFNAGPDIKNMAISEDPNFTNAIMQAYASPFQYTISNGAGTKTIYAKFYNSYGLYSQPISGNIVFETASQQYIFTKTLNYGNNGSDILALQKILAQQGFLTAAPNGHYGPATLAAVKEFQKANNINAVGYVGPATSNALNNIATRVPRQTKQQLIQLIEQEILQLQIQIEKLSIVNLN